MKQLLLVLALASFTYLLASCGASKKLKSANAEIENLTSQITGLNKQIGDGQATLTQLKAENVQYGKEAEDCRKTKEAIMQRVDNLNNALAERGTSMQQIREKAAKALESFIEEGATVKYQQGMVHISIPDKLAFPSGSTKVSDAGRQVMSVVADVLNDNPGVTAIIIGNTDSIAIKKTYTDNWSLSTERANAMVRVLRDTYDINPIRLTSAGKGKYNPKGDNATAEGRAMNRRTDIIINPDLSRLWELSENPQ